MSLVKCSACGNQPAGTEDYCGRCGREFDERDWILYQNTARSRLQSLLQKSWRGWTKLSITQKSMAIAAFVSLYAAAYFQAPSQAVGNGIESSGSPASDRWRHYVDSLGADGTAAERDLYTLLRDIDRLPPGIPKRTAFAQQSMAWYVKWNGSHAKGYMHRLSGNDSSTLVVHSPTLGRKFIDAFALDFECNELRPPFDRATLKRFGFTHLRIDGAGEYTWKGASASDIGDMSCSRWEAQAEELARSNGVLAVASDMALVFVSQEAMSEGTSLLTQGITDPQLLAPYVACFVYQGDRVSRRSYHLGSSEVLVLSGRGKGCRGWILNESLAN